MRAAADPSAGHRREQRLGGRLVGDQAVDQPPLQRGGDGRELAPALGERDHRRAVAVGDRRAGGALVGAAAQQPAVAVEDPAADLAGGAGGLLGLELARGQEAVDEERRGVVHLADADEGDVGGGGERQRRADQALAVHQRPLLRARRTKTGSGIGKCRASTASAIEKITL